MTVNKNKLKYIPGIYATKRADAAQMVDQYFREWETRRRKMKEKEIAAMDIPPAICISRKIGVGALEIADILAEKINFRVADRELLDYIAQGVQLSDETVAFFDERYPGKMVELSAMILGEKSFIMSDYLRNFISAVFTFAHQGPTIFVGRGTHLILPRERVLAVRFICSNDYRIERLASILGVAEKKAKKMLGEIDKEQRDFFKKAFGKKDASPYEFDMIINCEFITEPQQAAEIVARAYAEKFEQTTHRR